MRKEQFKETLNVECKDHTIFCLNCQQHSKLWCLNYVIIYESAVKDAKGTKTENSESGGPFFIILLERSVALPTDNNNI